MKRKRVPDASGEAQKDSVVSFGEAIRDVAVKLDFPTGLELRHRVQKWTMLRNQA